jgi:hypothetical protein
LGGVHWLARRACSGSVKNLQILQDRREMRLSRRLAAPAALSWWARPEQTSTAETISSSAPFPGLGQGMWVLAYGMLNSIAGAVPLTAVPLTAVPLTEMPLTALPLTAKQLPLPTKPLTD